MERLRGRFGPVGVGQPGDAVGQYRADDVAQDGNGEQQGQIPGAALGLDGASEKRGEARVGGQVGQVAVPPAQKRAWTGSPPFTRSRTTYPTIMSIHFSTLQ
ncbi:hypothetical protein GCM10010517_76340 [Streptosporangium fragile]|uniref:Uncharacterized protein n=1 Tax=Streptosporangium fragile TaxID=46186 RepID=A0ABN3WCV4_9ACTN